MQNNERSLKAQPPLPLGMTHGPSACADVCSPSPFSPCLSPSPHHELSHAPLVKLETFQAKFQINSIFQVNSIAISNETDLQVLPNCNDTGAHAGASTHLGLECLLLHMWGLTCTNPERSGEAQRNSGTLSGRDP